MILLIDPSQQTFNIVTTGLIQKMSNSKKLWIGNNFQEEFYLSFEKTVAAAID